MGPLSSSSNAANTSSASVLEDDGSLRFFWLDYLELDGRLYFTGKVKDKTTGTWVSCCVTVENIERNLYVLPRNKQVELVDEALVETDIVPSTEDVHDEFDTIRKQMGIKSWRGKFVKRKYVFGEEDIPKGESQWMKVVYSFAGQSVFQCHCFRCFQFSVYGRETYSQQCLWSEHCKNHGYQHQRI
jgi:DNA polymerase alpha subunit A